MAARLSRYLQVLIQARKMGKETISSQELAEYTHINSTQIRRDLSGFGKFGKRGVGYRVDSLVEQIRKILRSSGQHNIVLFGAGNLGQAIASSDIFADHGFQIVAIFDVDPKLVGRRFGDVEVHGVDDLERVVDDQDVVVGVLAVPSSAAQDAADRLVDAGRADHLQLLRAAAPGAAGRDRPHLEPRGRPALRALLLPDLSAQPDGGVQRRDEGPGPARREIMVTRRRPDDAEDAGHLDLERTREVFEASTDFTIGLEEEFAIVDPETLELRHRFEDLYAACLQDDLLAESAAGELIASEIEIRSGQGGELRRGGGRASASVARGCSRSPRDMGLALAATGTHPVGQLPRPADHRHAALRPAARRAPLGGAAQQHLEPSRPRRACAAPTGRSPCATTCGACCPPLLAVSANSPFLDGRDTGLHSVRTEIFTRTFPRCGVHEPFGGWDGYADFVEPPRPHQLDRRGDAALVERPPASRVRHRRAADLRRADPRARSRSRSPR